MHNKWLLSFWYFNSIFNSKNFLYFRREGKKSRAVVAMCALIVSIGGHYGNEAKVDSFDFCETQKGELLSWPFKPPMNPPQV
jgi:hypothetical protein